MKFLYALGLCAMLSNKPLFTYASPLSYPVLDAGIALPILPRTQCKPVSKANGRLFSIGGTTQYFAGTLS